MSSVVEQGAGYQHQHHAEQQCSDLLFPGLVIEESITSQLIDQRVLRQSGAPSTAADSSVSADNQRKWIYGKTKKPPQILYALTQNSKSAYRHKTHTYIHTNSILHRPIILGGKHMHSIRYMKTLLQQTQICTTQMLQ